MSAGGTRGSARGRSRGSRGRSVRARGPTAAHDLHSVGDVVSALLERRGIAEKVERAGVLAHWDDLVGPQIARVARPARLREGTLFVEVASAAWSMELNMMRRQLMKRLNEGRRRGRIERLVFLQAEGGRTERQRATGRDRDSAAWAERAARRERRTETDGEPPATDRNPGERGNDEGDR